MRVRFYMNFGTYINNCTCRSWGHCHSPDCLIHDKGHHRQYTQRQKMADLLLRTMALSQKERVCLTRRESTWIDCTGEEFARFIIERNQLGITNLVKDLQAVVISDGPTQEEKLAILRQGCENLSSHEVAPNDLRSYTMISTHHRQGSWVERAFRDRGKKKRKKHIFFVLKGVTYDKPEWNKCSPKAEGWYFCQEGDEYACSMSFPTQEAVRSYLAIEEKYS